jgi:prevent-host-death family protein
VVKTISVVEAKSHFSALLAHAEAGEEIEVTRRGKVVARLVPARARMAADLFRAFWEDPIDLEAPPDALAELVAGWDD